MADRAIKPDSGNQLVLQDEGGSAALTIQTDGDLSIVENIYLASGKGIYFDGGTTSANYLGGSDAYEEGSWTPALVAEGSSTTMTLRGTSGRYTKIGNTVHLFFTIKFRPDDTTGESGDYVINGCPFTAETISTDLYYTGALFSNALGGSASFNILAMQSGSSSLRVWKVSTGEANAAILEAGESAGGSDNIITGTITHRV